MKFAGKKNGSFDHAPPVVAASGALNAGFSPSSFWVRRFGGSFISVATSAKLGYDDGDEFPATDRFDNQHVLLLLSAYVCWHWELTTRKGPKIVEPAARLVAGFVFLGALR